MRIAIIAILILQDKQKAKRKNNERFNIFFDSANYSGIVAVRPNPRHNKQLGFVGCN